MIRFKATADSDQLEVSKYKTDHCHPISEAIYNYHIKQCKLECDDINAASYLFKKNCPKGDVHETFTKDSGKHVTMKDLHNWSARVKSEFDQSKTPSKLNKWVCHPSLDTEYVTTP